MKNVLWKLRKILPALLFFVTCGMFVVYATSSNSFFSNKYNTDKLNNILTDGDWNNLMTDLDNYLIPDGTVMAFNTNECPEWWFDYDLANWRFIVWIWSATMPDWTKHSYTDIVDQEWWDYRTKLTVKNLPPHNHKIFIEYRWNDSSHNPGDVVWVGHHKSLWDETKWTGYWYTELKWRRTDGDMNGTTFNAKIPYIGLKYCVKWNYTPPTKYTVTIKSNNQTYYVIEFSGSSITTNNNTIKIGWQTITATATNGYIFNGWDNQCWSTLRKNCSVTVKRKQSSWWCFLKWTHILMKDWYKNIEDIKVGDFVLSYNENSHKNEYNKVIKTFIHENNSNDLYQLSINGEILEVTNIHPFYVKRDWNKWYQWIEAQDLKTWDELLLHNWTYEKIEKIVHRPYQWNVYNIEVENMHNYYAGKWYLVHNKIDPEGQSGGLEFDGGDDPKPNP